MNEVRGTVLYIGGFELPDKNAAAHRVLSVAKIFRDLGYNVEFLNKTNAPVKYDTIEGFTVHNQPKATSPSAQVRSLFRTKDVINYLKSNPDVVCVVAYNYPSFALNRIRKYCNKKNIKCIADVTEWYKSFYLNPLRVITKGIDSVYRMRYVHKKLDGIIAISDYLEKYYSSKVKVINLPPLVDKTEAKWKIEKSEHKGTKFVYAGSPSRTKERLDLIVDAVENLSESFDVSLSVVGITENQFFKMYDIVPKPYSCIKFLGKVSHTEALNCVAQADYSFLIRDENRVTLAGFPTKFVESISAGTAVIANDNSNVARYLEEGVGGYIVDSANLVSEVERIVGQSIPRVDTERFDYCKYIDDMKAFVNSI